MHRQVFLVATILARVKASSFPASDEACAEEQICSGASLLQASRGKKMPIVLSEEKVASGINPSGAAASLDDTGYHAVADRCCQAEMKVFIGRVVQNLGLDVCEESGLSGIVPSHSCEGGIQNYSKLVSDILEDSAQTCTWVATTGNCKPYPEDCPTFENVPPMPDCGCSLSKAVLLDFAAATMVNNNLGGKGPAAGPQEMRFSGIAEHPVGQSIDLIMKTDDRYDSCRPDFNGVTKFPGFGNVALSGAETNGHVGFNGEIKVQASFVRTGTATPVELPEFFFAIFDLDGSATGWQTLSAKGYAGYVTDEDTVLKASKGADGSTKFEATARANVDNPTDPLLATKAQRQNMVMYFFSNMSSFEVTLGLPTTGAGFDDCRNFNFAGKSALMDRCGP